ncbi:hypothetical protein IVB02_39695 [Bradyrhizobium sp. 166]|uniref:hypothetical protein n=1 Tax=Bradyrhizobium sp. 166 TaxID=2782638 RepID=UPI001FFBF720|nr:hypothetical protein [Bradyrhizobium sp. 166]MCK1607341.1 hypothetical protein [Bradyrhizobium sp. 166]
MNQKKLFLVDGASDNLLSNLDSRDIALWLIDLPKECPQLETLISFLGLPWRPGQQAVRAATALDTSIVEFRDVFRLHPHMPTSGNLDPKTLQKAFERENLAYKGLNWELEDLLPNHFFDLLVQDHPSAVIRADKVADKVHWELTRDGKALLRKMIRQFGTHADLSATIAVLKAFHFYCSIAKRQ